MQYVALQSIYQLPEVIISFSRDENNKIFQHTHIHTKVQCFKKAVAEDKYMDGK